MLNYDQVGDTPMAKRRFFTCTFLIFCSHNKFNYTIGKLDWKTRINACQGCLHKLFGNGAAMSESWALPYIAPSYLAKDRTSQFLELPLICHPIDAMNV